MKGVWKMNEVTKRFLRLFNDEQDFYECHEIFEEAWKRSQDPVEAQFYKALVQVATAQFKLKKGVLRGVRKLYEYAYPSLQSLPDKLQGVDLAKLRQDFQALVDGLPSEHYIGEDDYEKYGLRLLKIHKIT